MVTGKKIVAMSSDGFYSEGSGNANDFVASYLKLSFTF